ncbi:histidine kinase [Streptomyces pluripotens]|uniref:Histidine kinase n=1 Tax=Streptomyces pluripotens TaxID=1355015 RepID=A0A221NSI0_9ACTN|nr:histidine kinase [Streptomyces pluripotens]ASN22894.1 histidine kinase [Streptomyces pluripotens]MCH0559276.1 CBS domain-containing protein [Streptomyces sp. MUM 16J]
MKVSEVMTAPPVTVAPHVPLLQVTRRMAESGVGSVLVVEDETLRGIVTDRDLAVRGLGGGLDPDTPVEAVMSAHVVTVDALDDVQAAYRTFRRVGVRRLPVLDGQLLVGVVTVDDLLLDVFRRLADLLGPVAWSVLQEPPGPPDADRAPYVR